MRPPEQVLRELVKQWATKAEVDFRAAGRLIEGDDPLREAVAFHCQQASEKYLKALLVRHQVEFPKTHNIRQLLDLVATVDAEMAESLNDAALLTPYGVDIRYPGDFPDVVAGQETALYEITGRVRAAVLAALKDDCGVD